MASSRRHRWIQVLLAWGFLFLPIAACAPPETLHPEAGTVRIGNSNDYRKLGDATRPIVGESSSSTVSLEVGTAPAGWLEIEAGLVGQDTTGLPIDCVVDYRAAGQKRVRKQITLQTPNKWHEARLEVTAVLSGATLVLDCDEARSVVWSQPRIVPTDTEAAQPLIVLLSLDTLRADHVSGFLEAKDLTPGLGSLGEEGIRFQSSVSQFTWTLPSHFALFYSRMFGFPTAIRPVAGLAQLLSEQGFATGGFTGGGFVGSIFRFHYGFDSYAEYDATALGKMDIELLEGTLEDAEKWIERYESVPSFAFVHTYAVHEVTPAEVELAKKYKGIMAVQPSAEQVAEAARFYVDLVEETDRRLTKFFDYLRGVAERRPVLVVVLSDHGEAFGEHDNFRHGIGGASVTLHDEVVRIPLIFWGPSVLADIADVSGPAMLLDIAPTLLAAVGTERPASMVGRDFWPMLSGHWSWRFRALAGQWRSPAVSYKSKDWGVPPAWGLRDSDRALIVSLANDPATELYNVQDDPKQRANLALIAPQHVNQAIADLDTALVEIQVKPPTETPSLPTCPHCSWRDLATFWDSMDPHASRPEPAPGEEILDEETRGRLKQLGYLE